MLASGTADEVPVVVGTRPSDWVGLLFLGMFVALPVFVAFRGSRWEGVADWFLAILVAAPFWLIAGSDVFDKWNRRHDVSEGQWVTGSVSLRSPARRTFFVQGRLAQQPARNFYFKTLKAVKPGDRVWIKLHPGALGKPWGSEWRITPPE